jgi:hypothetical protein
MSCPDGDQTRPNPSHLEDIAGTFVACVKCSRAIPIVDIPDVQESVIGRSKTREMLRVGTESYAFDAKGVIAETGQRSIRRGLYRCGKEQDPRSVARLHAISFGT